MDNKHNFNKGQFYQGKIARIEPSLAAAFVDIGDERFGFLPFSNIEHYCEKSCREGLFIAVCIDKPVAGQKGALLSAPSNIPTNKTVHQLVSTSSNKRLKSILFCLLVVFVIALLVTNI